MPRRLRVEFAGAIHHITVRGNSRRAIFKDDGDRQNFVERLGRAVEDYGVRVYLYCLMLNHYHLLVETPKPSLSRFMGAVGTGHAVYFNKRHRDVGHLYQGRFDTRLVEGSDYLLKLSRYMHLNPVQTRGWEDRSLKERVEELRRYGWSSYRAYIGKAEVPGWLSCGPVLAQMEGSKDGQPERYRQYVEAGLAESDEEFKDVIAEAKVAIGGNGFVEEMEKLAVERVRKLKRARDADFRAEEKRVAKADILAGVAEAFGTTVEAVLMRHRRRYVKAVAARMLLRHGGLTNRAAAEALGLRSGSAVSWQMRRLDSALESDRDLCRTVERINDRLLGL